MSHNDSEPSSFRDPAGFVYTRNGELYRQVNASYQTHYERLMGSGLYESLVEKDWLVAHEEQVAPADVYRVIKPARISQISYPYEWSFSQFKAAAELTLDVQALALQYDMTLKDASAYNIQFWGCEPVFIDTLSFECLDESQPWVAYKQFCEHFLGPLALMSRLEPRVRKLLLGFIDGLPLDLVSRSLPFTTRFNYSLLVHLHLHARSQIRHSDAAGSKNRSRPAMSKKLLAALVESLKSAVKGCTMPQTPTEWGDYYQDTNYTDSAMQAKQQHVSAWLNKYWRSGQTIHDLGANTGRFSRLSADATSALVVAHDIDELAVERNFVALQKEPEYRERILPLVLDLSNPTPSIGWAHAERSSFSDRCRGGFMLALALIHHLAIGNNTPLDKIAAFFAEISDTLLIEFVPKSDSQVQRLLATREDVFPDYTQQGFEEAFGRYFKLTESKPVSGSDRVLYLWTTVADL